MSYKIITTKTVVWALMVWAVTTISSNISFELNSDYQKLQDALNKKQIAQENIELKDKKYGTKSVRQRVDVNLAYEYALQHLKDRKAFVFSSERLKNMFKRASSKSESNSKDPTDLQYVAPTITGITLFEPSKNSSYVKFSRQPEASGLKTYSDWSDQINICNKSEWLLFVSCRNKTKIKATLRAATLSVNVCGAGFTLKRFNDYRFFDKLRELSAESEKAM